MPRLMDTMTEGTIATWLKKVGDTIKEESALLVATEQMFKAVFAIDCRTNNEVVGISAKNKTNSPLGWPQMVSCCCMMKELRSAENRF